MCAIKLTVIIVNYNTKDMLKRCLDEAYRTFPEDMGVEVIVVDNGSEDGSANAVRKLYPEVRLISNRHNRGFGAANNEALPYARGKYTLFLNTDVLLEEDTVSGVISFMDAHPSAGICTPLLLRPGGRIQESYISFPGVITELFGRMPPKIKKHPFCVDAVRGACMAARTDAVRSAGGFSDRYFLFMEETDLCMRLREAGFSIWCLPSVRVCHTGGATAGKNEACARIEYWKSRYIFFKEHYGVYRNILLNIFLPVKAAAGILFNPFSPKRVKIYSLIFLWHILGRPGDWGISLRDRKKHKVISFKAGHIEIIKENKKRRIELYNNRFYIKTYKGYYILKRPWIREWRMLNKLVCLDLPVPVPAACSAKKVVTEKIDGVTVLSRYSPPPAGRILFTMSLAAFVRRLHRKGLHHRDLHSGNILVKENAGRYEFFITDLHRARIKLYLSESDITAGLAQFGRFFYMNAHRTDRLRFFKAYARGTYMERDYKRYARYIEKKIQKGCLRLWRRRDSQYLKRDKYGRRGVYGGIRYIVRPGSDPMRILDMVRNTQGEIIKNSAGSLVSVFGGRACGGMVLRVYRQKRIANYIKDCFRISKGFKAWRAGWMLASRGIPAPLPVMAGEKRRYGAVTESFIVTEYIPDSENLTLLLRKRPAGSITDNLQAEIKKMCTRGIFHPDLKGSNILVDKSGRIFFIDLEHIKRRKISFRRILRNIHQVHRSSGIWCCGALPVKRILILKPSSLGDIAGSIPAVSILRQAFPGAGIYWMVNREYAGFAGMCPFIDKIIIFERKRWRNILGFVRGFPRFILEVRRKKFSAVLDMQGLFRTGIISALSGAPLRVGFADARECARLFYSGLVCADKRHMNAGERYKTMSKYLGAEEERGITLFHIPRNIIQKAETLWENKDIRIIVNPGGRWPSKRWPADRYAQTVDILNGWGMDIQIILTGGKDDIRTAEKISGIAGSNVKNLAGKTTLEELTALLDSCTLLITNDSGPMHIADIMGKPIVAIFGPTDPARTGPAGHYARVLRSDKPCMPCFRRFCGKPVCMEEITPGAVCRAVRDLLQLKGAVI